MTQSIQFIYNWGKSSRDQAWSGTPHSIERALSEKIEILDFDLRDSTFDKCISKLVSLSDRISHGYNFNLTKSKLGEKQMNATNRKVGDPELIFLEYITDNIMNSYIYQDLSVDYIARMRGTENELTKYTPLPPRTRKRIVEKRVYRTNQYYNRCRGIFTMSKWLAEDLVKNTGISEKKVHHVGGGCNIDVSKVSFEKKTGNKFLFVGKDFERKNGPLVLNAFKEASKIYPELELYIAGPENIEENQEQLSNLHILGRLNYKQLEDYFNLCDFFILPSQFEAYGLVFAEALIFGLPCIGKNAFAMPEFIEHGLNGLLVESDEVEELSKSMLNVYENREEMTNYVQGKHLEYLEKYSWSSVAERMIEVFIKDGYKVKMK